MAAGDADLGVLAAQLFHAIDARLWESLAEQGFTGLRSRYGPVLANLTEEGIRAGVLARLTGQNKQVVSTAIDELEALGYVERRPDPVDRRAKLVFPTERGSAEIRAAGRIVRSIEKRYAEAVGADRYAEFKAVLRELAEIGRPGPYA